MTITDIVDEAAAGLNDVVSEWNSGVNVVNGVIHRLNSIPGCGWLADAVRNTWSEIDQSITILVAESEPVISQGYKAVELEALQPIWRDAAKSLTEAITWIEQDLEATKAEAWEGDRGPEYINGAGLQGDNIERLQGVISAVAEQMTDQLSAISDYNGGLRVAAIELFVGIVVGIATGPETLGIGFLVSIAAAVALMFATLWNARKNYCNATASEISTISVETEKLADRWPAFTF
jgi:hypothetical protein